MSDSHVSMVLPQEVWDDQVASTPQVSGAWLWPGFLARGNLTLLTSMWKAGKTTLLAHLLARRLSGQPLLGMTVAPGRSVVISEEPRSLWAERCRRFAFGGQLCLFPEPFAHLPSGGEWRSLLEHIDRLRGERQVDLIVIDSLTHFLRTETAAAGVLDLLLPLRELAQRGMAVLLMHHPRRQGATLGNAGRGHGSLHSEVDISIEMRHAGPDIDGRARRFFCLSRHAETPRRVHFELNADGTDYTLLAEAAGQDDGFSANWEVLRMVLEDAPRKLTRNAILEDWPDDFPKPHEGTLARWLRSAVSAKLAQSEGTGRKADPYRYWLESSLERWRKDPMYEFNEMMDRARKPFLGRARRSKIC